MYTETKAYGMVWRVVLQGGAAREEIEVQQQKNATGPKGLPGKVS
jgi:hypothetical protein